MSIAKAFFIGRVSLRFGFTTIESSNIAAEL
jgi:hypothetical protein